MSKALVKEKCKSCGYIYNTEEIKLITEKLEDDIEQIYYVCPKCGYKFDICITNADSRMMQRSIQYYANKVKKNYGNDNDKDLLKDCSVLNDLIKKHKELMDKINKGEI